MKIPGILDHSAKLIQAITDCGRLAIIVNPR
jgi:hypothetical protein